MADIPPDFGRPPKLNPPFSVQLSTLCAAEASAAHSDPERIAAMVERLTHALAFTIAVGTGGNQQAMSDLIEGATAYLLESAAGHQGMAQMLERARRHG
jgi:hypothetical protein